MFFFVGWLSFGLVPIVLAASEGAWLYVLLLLGGVDVAGQVGLDSLARRHAVEEGLEGGVLGRCRVLAALHSREHQAQVHPQTHVGHAQLQTTTIRSTQRMVRRASLQATWSKIRYLGADEVAVVAVLLEQLGVALELGGEVLVEQAGLGLGSLVLRKEQGLVTMRPRPPPPGRSGQLRVRSPRRSRAPAQHAWRWPSSAPAPGRAPRRRAAGQTAPSLRHSQIEYPLAGWVMKQGGRGNETCGLVLGLDLGPVGDGHEVVVHASFFQKNAGNLGTTGRVEGGEGGLLHCRAGHLSSLLLFLLVGSSVLCCGHSPPSLFMLFGRSVTAISPQALGQ